MTTKPIFTLTSQMVEHLKLINDDDHLGMALVALFHHKIDGHEFVECANKCTDMNFIVALLSDDLAKANKTNARQRRCRDNSVTVTDMSQQSPSSSLREKESSPYNPFKDKENTPTNSPSARAEEIGETEICKLFDMFWSAYPRKTAKIDALKAFSRHIKTVDNPSAFVDMVCSKIKTMSNSFDWTKDEGKYIPYPATWIRGERWNDVISDESVKEIDIDAIADRVLNSKRD